MSLPPLRAPKEHGEIVAVPPLDQVAAMLANTHPQVPFTAEMRLDARREILERSRQYHVDAGEPVPAGGCTFMAGHQPELFHPGVWFKNFALQHLARKHGGGTLNLIIDTDVVTPTVLHAPSEGRIARAPFDQSTVEMPYEERVVEDERLFADLPARMAPIIAKWNFTPMLESFWSEAVRHASRTPLLGERFSYARRAMERRWGFAPRELPMSQACQTKAFAEFAMWVLGDLPRFHATYNRVVREYRREHGIGGLSRPVPDLAANGDWLEAPFWAWQLGQKRREKLLVRRRAGNVDLRIEGDIRYTLPLADPIAAWRNLEPAGFKVRARALTTTMFARLMLADVFVHGIGGGIYDELTDRIVASLCGSPPPPYLVLSATLYLPLQRFPKSHQQARDWQRRLRDLTWKPDKFVDRTPASEPLILEKQAWINRAGSTHSERVERFEQIRAINATLLPSVQPHADEARSRLEECGRHTAWDDVARRRDYAFCLYPEAMLREFFATALGP